MITNCDLGECLVPNPDASVMPLIGMASIACGGHAGNDQSMVEAIKLAVKNKVRIGVHPSYADQENFGRISQKLSVDELYELVYNQVSHFQALCQQHNARLEYIKPHGALYHDMMHQSDVFEVLCRVINAIDPKLDLVIQAGLEVYVKNFENMTNGRFLREVFADRGYIGLNMIDRGEKNAVLDDSNAIIKQFLRFYKGKDIKIDTICFHSDNPASVEALKTLKHA
jgi:5-oxoprolinase (ATP-hydrolysing) subunit A